MIAKEDIREHELLSRIPIGDPPHRHPKPKPSAIWFGFSKLVEVALCLAGFGVVIALFLLMIIILCATGFWWAALVLTIYYGGDFIEHMQKGKR